MLALNRYVFLPNSKKSGMPWLFLVIAGPIVKKRSKAQGYGLHSQEEGIYSRFLFFLRHRFNFLFFSIFYRKKGLKSI